MRSRRASPWYSIAALALGVIWACGDSAAPDDDHAAGGASEGGASGSNAAGASGADAGSADGGTSTASEGGQSGAGATTDSAGSSGLGGFGAAAQGGVAGQGTAGFEAAGAGGHFEPLPSGPPLEVSGAEAKFSDAAPPDPWNPKLVPPIEELFAAPSVTNGGSTVLGVRTASPLAPPRFVVAFAEADGHYVVEAETGGDGVYEIEIHVARYVRAPTITVRIAAMDARGNIGAYQTVVYSLIHVGTGDVTVTLSIEQNADLDLSVIEPSGFEISYQLPVSPTGGQLDTDSNAACEFEGAGSGGAANGGSGSAAGGAEHGDGSLERVWWPSDSAPTGPYEVYVKNYDDCGVAPLTFTVTVLNGSTETSYSGRFPINSIGESALVAKFEHR